MISRKIYETQEINDLINTMYIQINDLIKKVRALSIEHNDNQEIVNLLEHIANLSQSNCKILQDTIKSLETRLTIRTSERDAARATIIKQHETFNQKPTKKI